MKRPLEGLSVIANKTPVVATHVGGFDAINTTQTQDRYLIEALTYIRPAAITTYQQRFLERLLHSKTSIGCIVAPFGYGKTSTAIDTWRVCEENGILAVPPFSCGSIAEMGKAIATGIEFRLGINSKEAKLVRDAYESYLVSSAKRMAEQDSEHYEIDFDVALRSIEDKIEQGYLHIDATGNHLLGFLEQLTQIVLESGFIGLLIIVDEFQQFLGNINKTVITNFRTLVWGLRTRGSVPLGFLITMDPDTERNLAERAGDILHRIKEDSLYLDFTDVYDRDFARLLWTRYAENFHFTTKNMDIVDNATLEAIGQICERHDLSNGPRTVIDLFQRIANLYIASQKPYTPIDLIDDFMTGEIRFDGDRSKLASLVLELTSYEYIKTSEDRLRTLKLISAFPRGCPKEVADSYGLGHAYEQLSDALRGEVLTELPEGMALIDLQRVGKPQNKLNIILKKYWMQITEDEIVTDRAVTLFAKYVITPLFPPYQNILSGWDRIETDHRLTPSGSYVQTFEGSFFDEYPKRRIRVEICRKKEQISQADKTCDIYFVFVLQQADEEIIQPSFDRENRFFISGIAINRPFGIPMPRDVRWIEDSLRPVVMSPAVVLSLIDYIYLHAQRIDGITELELQRIDTHSKKLNDFLISIIFGIDLFAPVGIDVISRGELALRHVLFHVLKQAYPDYQTLVTSPQWESVCKNYITALSNSNPIHTRGLEYLRAEKSEIAASFGFRSHAGFESQIRQYANLVALKEWSGNQGAIHFERHPGENLLLNAITVHGTLTNDFLTEEAKRFGYLPEETAYLLEFLLLRGFVEKEKNGCFKLAKTLSKAELITIAKETESEAIDILDIAKLPDLVSSNSQTQNIINILDETELTEVQIRILQFQHTVQNSRPLVIKELQNNLIKYRADLYKRSDAFGKMIPLSKTGLVLDSHINGVQRSITAKVKNVASQITKLVSTVNGMLASLARQDVSSSSSPIINQNKTLYLVIEDGLKTAQDLINLIDQHTQWIKLLDRLRWIRDYLQILETEFDVKSFTSQYHSLSQEIMEGLSIKGISVYSELYNEYAPHIQSLYDEISVAIKASDIKNQNKESRASEKSSKAVANRTALSNLTGEENTVFENLVMKSGLNPEEFLSLLLQLERDGIIKILFPTGKSNESVGSPKDK